VDLRNTPWAAYFLMRQFGFSRPSELIRDMRERGVDFKRLPPELRRGLAAGLKAERSGTLEEWIRQSVEARRGVRKRRWLVKINPPDPLRDRPLTRQSVLEVVALTEGAKSPCDIVETLERGGSPLAILAREGCEAYREGRLQEWATYADVTDDY
jgi:hypothetical protein